jgi:glyceraldehyde 3-phosphate dehydrogenase
MYFLLDKDLSLYLARIRQLTGISLLVCDIELILRSVNRKPMRVAINGMGRIGRLLFRRLVDHPEIHVVAVNDVMDLDNMAYLVQYDSVYGKFALPVAYRKNKLVVGYGIEMGCFNEPDPLKLPWKDLNIDVVLECTGRFTTRARASQHRDAGAKKVLLSTSGSDDIPLMIFGHNQQPLSEDVDIVSPGGCMTNCSTHLIYLINSIGIESLHINVMHSYTSRQELVDAPHKDYRRGRAAAESIIPVQVDLAHSLEKLFPPLKDRIAAVTTRVPVANGALGDFTFHLKEEVTTAMINQIFKIATADEYRGIVEYTEEPLVSLDVKGNSHSAIIDGSLTSVVGSQVKIFAFFDNEYGYTSRIIDWLTYWNESS